MDEKTNSTWMWDFYSADQYFYRANDTPGSRFIDSNFLDSEFGTTFRFKVHYRFLIRIVDICDDGRTVASEIVDVFGERVISKADVVNLINR